MDKTKTKSTTENNVVQFPTRATMQVHRHDDSVDNYMKDIDKLVGLRIADLIIGVGIAIIAIAFVTAFILYLIP